jgi:HSP90 family molecular chaperone
MSSSGKLTSLQDYVSRMKDKQETIFYMAGSSKDEVEKSPFVERLLKKGYEVLYLTEAVDEYAISALPEFEGTGNLFLRSRSGIQFRNFVDLAQISTVFDRVTGNCL